MSDVDGADPVAPSERTETDAERGTDPECVPRAVRVDADVDVVLGGSVITVGDAGTMRQAGVAATFGADSKPDQVVADIQALAAARQQRLRGDPRI